jgi:hypothetical protein
MFQITKKIQHPPFLSPLEFFEIGIFGLKTNHLATLTCKQACAFLQAFLNTFVIFFTENFFRKCLSKMWNDGMKKYRLHIVDFFGLHPDIPQYYIG